MLCRYCDQYSVMNSFVSFYFNAICNITDTDTFMIKYKSKGAIISVHFIKMLSFAFTVVFYICLCNATLSSIINRNQFHQQNANTCRFNQKSIIRWTEAIGAGDSEGRRWPSDVNVTSPAALRPVMCPDVAPAISDDLVTYAFGIDNSPVGTSYRYQRSAHAGPQAACESLL